MITTFKGDSLRIHKLPLSIKTHAKSIKNREIVLDYIAKSEVEKCKFPIGYGLQVVYNPKSRHYEIKGWSLGCRYALAVFDSMF